MDARIGSKFAKRLAGIGAGTAIAAASVVAGASSASAFVRPCCTYNPNNKPIVFASNRNGNMDIYSQYSDGSGLKQLTTDPSSDSKPSVDAGQTKVAFDSARLSGIDGIYVMNTDGTNQHRVSSNKIVDIQPSLNATGTKIAFTSSRGAGTQVYVMNVDGTGATLVSGAVAGANSAPAWSPDGQRIAFLNNLNGISDVWMVNANGTGAERETFDGRVAADGGPTWSPDGQKLAYSSTQAGDTEVFWSWAFSVQAPVRVTNRPGLDLEPSWSPDGSAIAYASGDGQPNHFWLAKSPANGGTASVVTSTGTTNSQPSWGYQSQITAHQ